MRLAVFENPVEQGSYESKLNHMLSQEFLKKGHDVSLYIPLNHIDVVEKDIDIKIINENMPINDNSGLFTKVLSIGDEWKKQKIYKYLYMEIMQKKIDALCMYISNYKMLKSLYNSVLLRSPLPIILIFDKVEAKDNVKFIGEVKKFIENKNIKILVLSFSKELVERRIDNMLLVTAEMLQEESGYNDGIKNVSNESFANLIVKIIRAEDY